MYNAYIDDSRQVLVIMYNGVIATEFTLEYCSSATCQVNGNRISLITSSPGIRQGRTYIMKENFCVGVEPMAIC